MRKIDEEEQNRRFFEYYRSPTPYTMFIDYSAGCDLSGTRKQEVPIPVVVDIAVHSLYYSEWQFPNPSILVVDIDKTKTARFVLYKNNDILTQMIGVRDDDGYVTMMHRDGDFEWTAGCFIHCSYPNLPTEWIVMRVGVHRVKRELLKRLMEYDTDLHFDFQ